MTEKRFRISQGYTDRFCHDWKKNKLLNFKQTIDCLNTFCEENERLEQKIGDLLYQVGEAGKNNETCRECECFIPEHKYCYMWDMEVEADDVVVACDQRKVKNTNVKEVTMNDN